MTSLSTIADVDPFVRANIYYIMQKKDRWVHTGNYENRSQYKQLMFDKYVKFAFGSEDSWLRSGNKPLRAKRVNSFNLAIRHWLARYYKDGTMFIEQEVITYEPDAVPGRNRRSPFGCDCGESCGELCDNYLDMMECDERCTRALCGNKESQKPAVWRQLVNVEYISESVGAGVVAKVALPCRTYLGFVSGVGVCKRKEDKLIADKTGNYLFCIDDKKLHHQKGLSAINPREFGNFSRYMNHSCQPSCDTEAWLCDGEWRIKIYTRRHVREVIFLISSFLVFELTLSFCHDVAG